MIKLIIILLLPVYLFSQEISHNDTLHIDGKNKIKKLAIADSIPVKIEPLPILSYDSNTGFGFGAKAFFLNLLKLRESFDLIIFLSTKGERWLRFVFWVLILAASGLHPDILTFPTGIPILLLDSGII